jgi:hypothetical protein
MLFFYDRKNRGDPNLCSLRRSMRSSAGEGLAAVLLLLLWPIEVGGSSVRPSTVFAACTSTCFYFSEFALRSVVFTVGLPSSCTAVMSERWCLSFYDRDNRSSYPHLPCRDIENLQKDTCNLHGVEMMKDEYLRMPFTFAFLCLRSDVAYAREMYNAGLH